MSPSIHSIDLPELTPMEVFLRLPQTAKNVAFLASNGSGDSRWSILAWDPVETVSFMNRADAQKLVRSLHVRRIEGGVHEPRLHSKIPFLGGAIGTINYEYGYQLLGIPYESGQKNLVEFSFYDQALVYDHHRKEWWGINMTGEDVAFVESLHCNDSTAMHPRLELHPSWNFDEYQKAFQVIHDHIRTGEIYQACLTFPFIGKALENPRQVFCDLLKKNPAPMAAYLEQSERTVMSFSPERFISWDGTNLETKPIKGTRPRGKDPQEDERLKNELLQDHKEEAELSMITDLLRNDMAKISTPGTVKVLEDKAIQKNPSVWHTYSRILSRTREGIEPWEILESMLPGGSISGCPKKRAVEILGDIEAQPRGIYTGCIGYISDHGMTDMNIAIRTLEQTKHELKAGFGSGIVFDSEAQNEYAECFAKAKNFLL